MKAFVFLWTVLCAIAPAVVANAQTDDGCRQIAQRLTAAATNINQNATAYWAHRAEFVDLIFGASGSTVPNAMQAAEQNKAQADALRATMPSTLANFKDLVSTARSQSCLPPAQLSAIVEPAIKLAKRVNFDQFPEELPSESTVEIGAPKLPH